jgi:hypothetical protein
MVQRGEGQVSGGERGTHWTKAVLTQDCARPNTTRRAARTWKAGTPVTVEWYDGAGSRAYVWCGSHCLFSVPRGEAARFVRSVK